MTTKKTEGAPEGNEPLTPEEEGQAIAEYSPFAECYTVDRGWRAFWGREYIGPAVGDKLLHGVWVEVAEWVNDDHVVKVCVSAMPARFYKVADSQAGLRAQIVTGSGEHRLAKMIAEAMVNGMLSVEVEDDYVRNLTDEARAVLGIPQRVG